MEEVLNVRVSGITDAGLLTQIAKSVFNEIGRGEMGGSVSTPNLASFGGDSSDPDLLSLSPGDGIELLVDTRAVRSGSPLISTFTESQRLSFDDQVKAVFKVLGNMTLARVIVATQRGQVTELQRFFLVQNVKYAWSDKGIKIDFDYTNYVQARWGVDEEVEINDPLIVTGTLVGQTTTVIAEGHVISAVAPIPPKPKPRKGKVVVITVTEGHVVKANAIRIQQEHVITATVTR
jgi:hypothetical protein